MTGILVKGPVVSLAVSLMIEDWLELSHKRSRDVLEGKHNVHKVFGSVSYLKLSVSIQLECRTELPVAFHSGLSKRYE